MAVAADRELGVTTGTAHAIKELNALIHDYRGTTLVMLDNADHVRWTEAHGCTHTPLPCCNERCSVGPCGTPRSPACMQLHARPMLFRACS